MNVICICLDTFRADLIGDGKLSFVKTPNIDSFARDSVVFDNAFGEGQPTLQMRRAFFTGMRSFPWRYNFDRRGHYQHMAGWHKIPPEQDTLAEILLRRGYMTGLISDTYHLFKPTLNFTRGVVNYDFIRGQEWDNWRAGTLKMVEDKMKKHMRQTIDLSRHAGFMQYLLNVRDRKCEEDYFSAQVFLRGKQWIRDNFDNQPFFLWLDCFDPHEPWDPPVEYADTYCPNYEGIDFIEPRFISVDLTLKERERIKALYYGEVTFVDKWLGVFLEEVNDLGLYDNTIIIILSDHGTQLMDHGRFGKGGDALHPYNTQIIWLLYRPNGPRGKYVKAFVQSHDLLPTILSLLGIPYAMAEGKNMWPLVTGELDQVRDHVVIGWSGFADGPASGRASVRDEEWNYVTSIDRIDPRAELYHLPEDPEEMKNVIAEYPEVVKRQQSRLEAVLGQPLPATMIEISDRSPESTPPIFQYYHYKRRQSTNT